MVSHGTAPHKSRSYEIFCSEYLVHESKRNSSLSQAMKMVNNDTVANSVDSLSSSISTNPFGSKSLNTKINNSFNKWQSSNQINNTHTNGENFPNAFRELWRLCKSAAMDSIVSVSLPP
jgi:hypothetical protein